MWLLRLTFMVSILPSTNLVNAKLPGPASYPERHERGGVPLPLTDHEQRMFLEGFVVARPEIFTYPVLSDRPCQVTSPNRSPALPTQRSVLPVGAGLTLAQHET